MSVLEVKQDNLTGGSDEAVDAHDLGNTDFLPLSRSLGIRPMVISRFMTALGLAVGLTGCLAPNADEKLGDRFPLPYSERPENPEFQRMKARPFDTYGYNEPIERISVSALVDGFRDLGRPKP